MLLFFLGACKSSEFPKPVFPKELSETDACFVLFDLTNDKMVEVINEGRCRQATAPCSTFKVPLAVMAAEEGLIQHEKTLFKWDQVDRPIADWNKDQTAKDWMQTSAVWVSQVLTRQMGAQKVSDYLKKFGYGNQDFSGGVESAWLTPAVFLKKDPNNSLKISAFEELEFLKKLFRNQLPVRQKSMDLAKRILPLEVSTLDSLLSGKTGSGFLGPNKNLRLGWYVSHVRAKRAEYLAILTFTDSKAQTNPDFGGRVAKESLKKMLFDRGIW